MIIFVDGTLEDKQPTEVILLAGGLGYRILISVTTYETLPKVGAHCRLLTYFHVREEAQQLYGFHNELERKTFLLLLAISGIGPRTALSILSGLPARELSRAVTSSDIKRLSSVPGIGKKTAERIIVELRDKMSGMELFAPIAGTTSTDAEMEIVRDAVMALVSLGYKQPDALKRVQTTYAKRSDHTVESLIRESLASK